MLSPLSYKSEKHEKIKTDILRGVELYLSVHKLKVLAIKKRDNTPMLENIDTDSFKQSNPVVRCLSLCTSLICRRNLLGVAGNVNVNQIHIIWNR